MRRTLVVVLGAIVVLAGLAGLALVFSARDDPGLEAPASGETGPGELQPDRGFAHGEPAPQLDPAALPTSGPHEVRLVTRDARELSADQLLHALELGNVVLAYGDRSPPAELESIQEDVAGPFDAELAASGLSVILARVPGLEAPEALAWRRRLRSSAPTDPALREFAESHLGRPAPGSR